MTEAQKPKRRRRAVAMVDKGPEESVSCDCASKDARIAELEAQLAQARAESAHFKAAFAAKRR